MPAGPEAMEVAMNEYVSAAEQQISSTGETPTPEFDALTWSAEHAFKAMVGIRWNAGRSSREEPTAISNSCGICATARGGRRSRKSSNLGSRNASPIMARSWAGSPVSASSSPGATSRRSNGLCIARLGAARAATTLVDGGLRFLTGFARPEGFVVRWVEPSTRGRRGVMNVRRPMQFGVLLTALVPLGAMALAQEQGQQVPMMGQGMHGTMGQQTDQPMMGSCPMMGQSKQGMVGRGMGPGMMHGGMGPGMVQEGGMARRNAGRHGRAVRVARDTDDEPVGRRSARLSRRAA